MGGAAMSGRAGPVKRVTLWVRDIEAALRVYRDALGLVVVEDKALAGPSIARMVGLEQASLRIVHLAAPGMDHGWVGLYAISDTQPTALPALPQIVKHILEAHNQSVNVRSTTGKGSTFGFTLDKAAD